MVAILRGLMPSEAIEIGTALFNSGITTMEVTLNSPEPLKSIELLANHFEGRMAIGAGTVLSAKDVENVQSAGGQFIVSPSVNVKVIEKTVTMGMYSIPGALTCTECFEAINAGANALKIFPASVVGVAGLKDMMAVIPKEIGIFAVGGVNEHNLENWLSIGIKGVGLGSNLYKAGDTSEKVAANAKSMIALMKRHS